MIDVMTEADYMLSARPTLPRVHDETLEHIAQVVQLAVGRLGCVLEPWLDTRLLLGRGLAAVLSAGGEDDTAERGSRLLQIAVDILRSWARASSWYRSAWPCRVAPLCAALRQGAIDDHAIAAELGIPTTDLPHRFLEAGLVFAVSPELMAPPGLVESTALASAVAELPAVQRNLLVLYFRDGLSFPEVAQLLELPQPHVQEIYGRAAASLRAYLARECADGITCIGEC